MAFTKVVGAGIHTLSNIVSHNINSSGIITATKFVGPFDGSNGDFSGDVTIDGNLVVNGTTTTLDTNLIDVDKIEVTTTLTNVAVAVTHTGSGDLIRLYDGSTQVVTVDDEGNVGIGTNTLFTGGAHSGTHQLTITNNNPSMSLGRSNTDQLYVRREQVNGRYTFQTNQSGGNNGVISLQPYGGNVGIGSASPANKLDVALGAAWIYPDEDGTEAIALKLGKLADYNSSFNDILVADNDGSSSPIYRVTSKINRYVASWYFDRTTSPGATRINAFQLNSSKDGPNLGNRFIIRDLHDTADSIKLWSNGDSFIGVTTDGTSRNFGIGTDNPAAELHVYSDVPEIRVQDSDGTYQFSQWKQVGGNARLQLRNGNSNGSFIIQGFGGGTATDPFVRVNSDGKVGIGTNLPTQKLDVVGISRFQGEVQLSSGNRIKLSNDSNTANVTVDCDGGARFHVKSYDQSVIQAQESWGVRFFQGSGTERLAIEPTGGIVVGVGGTIKIPDKIMHVGDEDTSIRFPSDNTISFETGGVERLQLDATEAFFNSTGSNTDFRVRSPAQGHLFFVDAGNDQVTIKTSSAQSGAVLTVNGRTHLEQLTLGNNSTLDAGAEATIYKPETNTLAFATAGANERLRITSGGQVQISGGSTPLKVTHTGADCVQFHRGSKYLGINADWGGNTGDSVISVSTNFVVHTNGSSERLRITSGGNVRHIGGGDNRMYTFSTDDTAHYMKFNNTLNGIILNGYGGIAFETNGPNERLRITSGGDVGIGGLTDVEKKVDIHTGDGGSVVIRPNGNGSGSRGDANVVNNLLILRMPYGQNAGSSNNAGARVGLQFTGRNDSSGYADNPGKSASIYGVSEDTGAGFTRKMGLAFYTSAHDAAQTERMRITADGSINAVTKSFVSKFHYNPGIQSTAGWSTNWNTIIPANTLNYNDTYVITAYWQHDYNGGNAGTPYLMQASFLFSSVSTNNTTAGNVEFVPFQTAHVGGGTHRLIFRFIPGTTHVPGGIQVKNASGFHADYGGIIVKAFLLGDY